MTLWCLAPNPLTSLTCLLQSVLHFLLYMEESLKVLFSEASMRRLCPGCCPTKMIVHRAMMCCTAPFV